jgi:hypothetical protein
MMVGNKNAVETIIPLHHELLLLLLLLFHCELSIYHYNIYIYYRVFFTDIIIIIIIIIRVFRNFVSMNKISKNKVKVLVCLAIIVSRDFFQKFELSRKKILGHSEARMPALYS